MMAVFEWLKARWQFLLVALALAGATVAGLLFRSKASPIVLPPVDGDQKKIEEETKQEEEQAVQDRDAQIADIEKKHAETIQQLDDAQKKKYDELSSNPKELNQFLLDVGKDIRR